MNPFRRRNRTDGSVQGSEDKVESTVPKPYTLEPKSSTVGELVNDAKSDVLSMQTGKTRPEFELRNDPSYPSVAVVADSHQQAESSASIKPEKVVVEERTATAVDQPVQAQATAAVEPQVADPAVAPVPVRTVAPAETVTRQPAPANDGPTKGISATTRPSRLGSDVKPVISVRAVKKIYQMGDIEVQALRGVDLDIFPGEIMAIMGPSGSGKSTLMNVLGCLDVPSEGTYLLDGVDVRKLSDNQLAAIRSRKIGFVFQSYNLLSRTSALANVELPLLYSGSGGRDRRQRAKESLTLVGLGERVHHRPNELSGGQQQRVAIARALINRPAMILADEPTGNLDSKTRVEIMKLFQRLNRDQGITIVFVTHDPETADYCERVVWIRDGVIARDDRHKIVAGIYAEGGENYEPPVASPAITVNSPRAPTVAPSTAPSSAVIAAPVVEKAIDLPLL